MDEGVMLLAVGAVLCASVLVALGAARTGVPVLVAFLLLGMLLGSDGPGGIEFDDAELARQVGIVGLVLILFEGGLQTSWRRLRSVAIPAALLSTIGVVVTAVLTGAAAKLLFDLTWLEAILLGAVVASTDAAAVFATLRFTHIRRRVARTLEAESGGNDPMAIALTVGLIAWIESPETNGFSDLALPRLIRELALGLVVGVLLGLAAAWIFGRLPDAIGAFRTGRVARGRGCLLRGRGCSRRQRLPLRLPRRSRDRKHAVPLPAEPRRLPRGHCVRRPGRDLHRARPPRLSKRAARGGVVRPRAGVTARRGDSPGRGLGGDGFQRLLGPRARLARMGGARGAIPIVLATFVLSSEIDTGDTIFNAVFFVVLVSTIVQSPTLEWVARRLDLVSPIPQRHDPPIEVGEGSKLDLIDFVVADDHAIAGAAVREVGLPRTAIIAVVVRGDDSIPPRGSTIIEAGDRLYVLVPRSLRPAVEDVFSRWQRRV